MEREDGDERLRRNGVSPPFDRLPPPMLPSGRGRPLPTPRASLQESEEGGGVPDDAFIMPDEPIRQRGGAEARSGGAPDAAADGPWEDPGSAWEETESSEEKWSGALIDPDAPIVRREPPRMPEDYERVLRGGTFTEAVEDEGVVTGIGDTGYDEMDDEELERLAAPADDDDPHVADLARSVGKLSEALRSRGEAGLRTTPEMTRFEATLRAYCVGYLTRAREGTE